MARSSFTVGSVLSTSFSIWGKNLAPFLTLTLLLDLPVIVLSSLAPASPSPFAPGRAAPADPGVMLVSAANSLLSLLVNQLVTAAVVFGVVRELKKQHVSMTECIREGLARLFPALGVAIVSGLGILLIVIVAILGTLIPGMMLFGSSRILAALIPFGSLMLGLAIAITLFCGWWVAIPAVVIERTDVFASLSRSWSLTRGRRWAVFGIILIVWFLFVALYSIVLATGLMLFREQFTGLISVAMIPTISLMAVVTAVGYYELRSTREGFDAAELAGVFD